jgi:putative heme-binding domain-containing protein
MARLPAEWKGDWWGATGFNPASRPRPAKTQDWEGTLGATAALREALTDSQPLVRRAAVVGLRRCHDVAVCELLHELVCRETELAVGKEIVATLGELKDPHIGDLLSCMITNAMRYGPLLPNAVAAAEQVESDGVTAPLTDLLHAKFGERLQILSIQALVKLKAESAIPAIARCIDEGNSNVWRSAIRALGQIGSDSSATTLAHKLTDHRPHVRQAVVDALGKLKNPAAVPALVAACQNKVTRPAAVSVLTRIPDVRALEVYLDGLQSNDELVQKMCLKALGAIQVEALPLVEERMARERKELIPRQFIPVLQKFGGGFNLHEWQCLGPLNDQSIEARLGAGSLGVSTKLVDRSGKVHRWRRVVGKPLSGHVNLGDWLDNQIAQTNSFVYMAARFTCPEEREMELAAVCPNASGLALWLNGRSLSTYVDSKQRIYRAAVTVKQRENDLLARIQNPHAVTQFGVNIAPARVRSVVASAVQPSKDAYAAWALNNHGNAARGRNWFSEPSGAGCIRCHRVNGEGGTIGPDLSSIGSKYNRAQLIETILYPSKQILNGYRPTLITTKEGESTTGLVQREDNGTITLLDVSGQEHTIKKSLITRRELSGVSPMPDGLYAGWSRRDFGDVIAFLEGLKMPQQAKLR